VTREDTMPFSFSNRGRARFGARLNVAQEAALSAQAEEPLTGSSDDGLEVGEFEPAFVADSEATTIAALRGDHNHLLPVLREAGVLALEDDEHERDDGEEAPDEADDEDSDDDDEGSGPDKEA